MSDAWPKNVGILRMELYFPPRYVDQTELEVYDGVSSGKYTIGLGQLKMGFCTDLDDINSLCLTVVHNLLEKNNIHPSDVGRLEVGTETIIDKSKSVKTVLMQLFEEYGCYDIEGIDTTNACYGGTAALFNAVSWIESSAWDGRYAIVVAGDIAVYAKGTARPTGGAGAVAMLIGPNAPLVFDRGLRACYMRHAYDFYKPDLSKYPTVDGKLSIECYLKALDNCYQLYCKKAAKKGIKVNLDYFDSVLFHSPYCKLVRKSLARIYLNDFIRNDGDERYEPLLKFKDVKLEESYFNRDIERAVLQLSTECFETKTKPSLLLASNVGNMYTASLYGGLISLLISKSPSELAGNKVCLFSYGSGLASTMFSLTISEDFGQNSPLDLLISKLSDVETLLLQRVHIPPEKFNAILESHEKNCSKVPYEPSGEVATLARGTYYLRKIDDLHRRFYCRIQNVSNGMV